MLVLSREVGEKIVIDGNITITVLSVRGNRVRLGIEAPAVIGIRRSEIEVQVPPGTDRPESGSEAA